MNYQGDIRLGDTIDFKFTTVDSTGAPTTLAGTPVISAYPGNSTTEITAGITLTVDFDARTGMHNVRVVATSGNGYATATNYNLVITTGTVSGVSAVGYVVGSFSIENRSAVMPTTAGRTLDVSAGGEAGVDWANVGTPGSTVSLSATTVATVTTTTTATNVTTVNGLAANVITAAAIADGAIDRATFAADTGLQSIRSNTAQAGAAGSITLDASASATTDFYKGSLIYLTGSTGAGQFRLCTAYDGTTKVATITPNWATNPSGTSTFAILPAGIVDVEAVNGSAVSAGATIDANVTKWLGTAVSTPTVAGVPNVNVKTWNDLTTVALPLVPTVAGRTLDVSAGGEAGIDWANVGTPGSTVSLSATTVATVTTTTTATNLTNLPSIPANWLTAAGTAADFGAEIADAVWDEAISGHLGAGSTGAALNAAGSAGDPWTTPLPGAYGAGTAGYIIGTYLVGMGTDYAGGSFVVATVTGDVQGSTSSVTGAVGSVTGNVGGNVTGSVGSMADAGASLTSIPWNSAWDTNVVTDANAALVNNNLDHLLKVAAVAGDVVNSSVIARLASKSATPAFTSYDNTTDSLEAQRDNIGTTGAALTNVSANVTEWLGNGVFAQNDDLPLVAAAHIELTTGQPDIREALGLASANLDTQLDALPTNSELTTALNTLLTTAMTESYNADGSAPTPAQALFVIMQKLTEMSIAGTTMTVKKLDGSTTAFTLTLNDATTPTAITRAT